MNPKPNTYSGSEPNKIFAPSNFEKGTNEKRATIFAISASVLNEPRGVNIIANNKHANGPAR